MTTLAHRSIVALVALVALAACSGGEAEHAADTSRTSAARDSAATTQGTQAAGSMTAQMEAHVRMLEGANGDSIVAMLPMHRQTVANMISTMNREMQGMNMSGDAQWTATIDSVRQDLVQMPDMGASELQEFMPAHRARVMRLMEAHRTMMGSMTR